MKKIILLFALLFSVISLGQSSELTNYTWRCTSVIIDGVHIPAPSNNEVNKVRLIMLQDNDAGTEDFLTLVCNSLSSSDGEVVYDNTQVTFTLPELIQSLITCDLGENQDFEGAYFGFFYDSQGTPLSYEIVELTEIVMTITSPNGDTAHYQEDSLGIADTNGLVFTIFPNPGTNNLTISTLLHIDSIEIFSVTGKKIASHTTTSIDISQWANGVYFIKVTSNGKHSIQKFIKR